MSNTLPALLSQKDIAQVLNVNVRTVRRNEESLGLKAIRINVNQRVVRYSKTRAIQTLCRRGIDIFS